jgi:hypothetical protein
MCFLLQTRIMFFIFFTDSVSELYGQRANLKLLAFLSLVVKALCYKPEGRGLETR